MSRAKTPCDDQVLPIPSSAAAPEVSPAFTAASRKRSAGLGATGEPGGSGKTLSMREFFEAGGRAYEVYLSCKDSRPLPHSPCTTLSAHTKDNGNNLNIDQLPPDVAAKDSGPGAVSTNPPLLTVVHLTTSSGPPTPSAPAYTQTSTGRRSNVPFPVTSRSPKDNGGGGGGAPGGLVTADVIDRVIASSLRLPERVRSSFVVDPFVWKDEEHRFAITGRHTKTLTPSMRALADTLPRTTSSPSVSSSSSSLAFSMAPTTPAVPSTTSCTSPMENSEGRPSTDRRKRKLTADEGGSALVIDLSSKRGKSADDDHCDAVNQSSARITDAPPIDGQKGAAFEADDRGISRPSIAGVVPKAVHQSATIFSDVTLWSVDQVVRFVANVQGCREYAEIFRQEEIDGACLIRLSEGHLLNVIRMRLGPALRLRQAITSLCSLDAI